MLTKLKMFIKGLLPKSQSKVDEELDMLRRHKHMSFEERAVFIDKLLLKLKVKQQGE